MKLTSENVTKIFVDCLFADEENQDSIIMVDGIMHKFGFHPERLSQHEKEIYSMLKQLPKEFQKDSGGGMSFLNACNTNTGEQWGDHQVMEQLFALGIACKKVTLLMPKELWGSLPGGMPYYGVE